MSMAIVKNKSFVPDEYRLIPFSGLLWAVAGEGANFVSTHKSKKKC